MRIARMLSAVAALASVAAVCNPAMALPPPAAPFTLWNFLGIPQGFNKIRDANANRFGNRPGMERKPRLKAIADPANVESSNPAIAAAAKIKTEEDLKPQKIKAIKYLARIGCGCYPDVKEALLAALDDCTEEVRYQAVLAIEDAASQHCQVCNKNCCCDKEVTLKLSQIAYELNDQGCPIEASERVREAAKRAMYACCPGQGPIDAEVLPESPPETMPEGAPTPPPSEPEAANRMPDRYHETSSRVSAGTGPVETDDGSVVEETVTVDFGNQQSQGGRTPVSATRPTQAPAPVRRPLVRPQSSYVNPMGPSSRRAAVARGVGAPNELAEATPAASEANVPNTQRAPVARQKQPTNGPRGWAWPLSDLMPDARQASTTENASGTSASPAVFNR